MNRIINLLVLMTTIVGTLGGCQQTQYSAGTGGNLEVVGTDTDGTYIFVPTEEFRAMSPKDRENYVQRFRNLESDTPD